MEGDTPGVTDAATAEPQLPTDRPVQNVMAEFNRKFSQQSQQIASLTNTVQTLAQAMQQQAQPPAGKGDTEDELFARAQQGDKSAFREWTDRRADAKVAERMSQERQDSLINGQIGVLEQKYPVFRDASHPLTQTAVQAYHLLVAQGAPQSKATLVDAMKTAVADRPDLVTQIYNKGAAVREDARRSATQNANSGTFGATHRNDTDGTEAPRPRVTEAEAAIAKRMGVADPAGAKARFLKRQETGQSSLGLVGQTVDLDKDFV